MLLYHRTSLPSSFTRHCHATKPCGYVADSDKIFEALRDFADSFFYIKQETIRLLSFTCRDTDFRCLLSCITYQNFVHPIVHYLYNPLLIAFLLMMCCVSGFVIFWTTKYHTPPCFRLLSLLTLIQVSRITATTQTNDYRPCLTDSD